MEFFIPGKPVLIPALELKIVFWGGGNTPEILGQDKNSPPETAGCFRHLGIHPQFSDLSFGFPTRPTLPGKQSSLFPGQVVANIFQTLRAESLEGRMMGLLPVLFTTCCVASVLHPCSAIQSNFRGAEECFISVLSSTVATSCF